MQKYIFVLWAIVLLTVGQLSGQEVITESGGFSGYLIGFYDVNGKTTIFDIANPTFEPVHVVFVFYDMLGRPFAAGDTLIASNGSFHFNILKDYGDKLKKNPFGLVKFVSVSKITQSNVLKKGIVGMRCVKATGFFKLGIVSESILPAVPTSVLEADAYSEWKKICDHYYDYR